MEAMLTIKTLQPSGGSARQDQDQQTDLILHALKQAIAEPTEHRLFRSGKLEGLFPSRTGPSATAALQALSEGLLETVRTESKGKLLIEWVTATDKAMSYVTSHDSPKAVLRDLREVLGTTRAAVPDWLAQSKKAIETLHQQIDQQAAETLRRLDLLADRVEAALRRMETERPSLPEPITMLVPWVMPALEFLDRHQTKTASRDCPLRVLFEELSPTLPDLTLLEFHTGLRRLHDARILRLVALPTEEPDPEFAMILGSEVCSHVQR
jgi:hypothetical protein